MFLFDSSTVGAAATLCMVTACIMVSMSSISNLIALRRRPCVTALDSDSRGAAGAPGVRTTGVGELG